MRRAWVPSRKGKGRAEIPTQLIPGPLRQLDRLRNETCVDGGTKKIRDTPENTIVDLRLREARRIGGQPWARPSGHKEIGRG